MFRRFIGMILVFNRESGFVVPDSATPADDPASVRSTNAVATRLQLHPGPLFRDDECLSRWHLPVLTNLILPRL
ncbi:MAG: hypothetical protein MK110_12545 [Fuerstiella sp.]|nr:hypothetical protein [Fuerstiella sp.]